MAKIIKTLVLDIKEDSGYCIELWTYTFRQSRNLKYNTFEKKEEGVFCVRDCIQTIYEDFEINNNSIYKFSKGAERHIKNVGDWYPNYIVTETRMKEIVEKWKSRM